MIQRIVTSRAQVGRLCSGASALNRELLAVTMASNSVPLSQGATPSSRDRPTRIRPSASWVEIGLPGRRPVESGTGGAGELRRGARARCSRRAATHCPAVVIGSSRSHSVAMVRPSRSRIWSIWAVESSAEWLRGFPAMGRPQPLTV